jgi:hypothetical protein
LRLAGAGFLPASPVARRFHMLVHIVFERVNDRAPSANLNAGSWFRRGVAGSRPAAGTLPQDHEKRQTHDRP